MKAIAVIRSVLILIIFFTNRASLAISDSPTSRPVAHPWLRLDTGLTLIKPNFDASYIAFVPDKNLGLRVLNTKTGKVTEPTGYQVGASFFWSPDGRRLFYRELRQETGKKPISKIRSWDIVQNKNVEIDTIDGTSGLLTFDPRDNRMLLMHEKGIRNKKLVFPDNRLAFWQSSQRKDLGKWVMAQKGVTFLTESGFVMQRLDDDKSGVESFDISPDGSTAAWATREGRIFTSRHGEPPEFLDWGRDPRWHPQKMLIVYAGGRMVGNKAASYDIKINMPGGVGSFLTATQDISERWPAWHPDGKSIFYTVEGTSELRVLTFDPTKSAVKKAPRIKAAEP